MSEPFEPRFGEGLCQAREIGPGRVDASVYSDPRRWERERERLFPRVWLIVDRAEVVPEAGDYLLWERSGQTVVIARQDDGSLAAFHNVCQHRGARIVSASGHSEGRRLVCRWHGFGYDLRGRVAHIPPRGQSFSPADVADLCAPAVAVEEWAGFIWINYAGERAEPLREYLAEVGDELDGYGIQDWKTYGGDAWEVPSNWKTTLDGFMEAWHTPTAHVKTLRGGFRYDETQFTCFDRHSMMVVPLEGIDLDALPQPIDHREHLYNHYLTFPNTIWSVFPHHAQVITVSPIDHARCYLQGWVMSRREAPPGVPQEKWERSNTTAVTHFRRVTSEDMWISSEAGATLRSYGYRRNILNEAECRITAYYQVLERYLSGESAA